MGRAGAADRASVDEPRRGRACAHGEAAWILESAAAGAEARARAIVVSESEARVGARELVSAVAEEEAGRSGLAMSGSGSATSARSGPRARRAARSRSTGGSCLRRLRCSTTWSCTSSATCAYPTTRRDSGSSSRGAAHTGAGSATWLREHGPELLAFSPLD